MLVKFCVPSPLVDLSPSEPSWLVEYTCGCHGYAQQFVAPGTHAPHECVTPRAQVEADMRAWVERTKAAHPTRVIRVPMLDEG